MTAIKVENICKSYGSQLALSDVSLSVGEGELFGLIGPDGAGKSTLFRILVTLLLADSGSASVMGLDVVNDYRKIRTSIGYMPGRFSLYQDLTVEENINFFASIFNVPRAEGYSLIAPIYKQLAPFKNRRAGKLSGGMKQKLALCCALIHKPKALFLDEPTAGVDAVSRQEFWELLAGLKRQGITILVSTPYMDEAMRCERIALISQGRILETDTPRALVERYRLPSIEDVFIRLMGGKDMTLKKEPYTPDAGYSIEVRDLTKKFGDFTAVDHISFNVGKGEIFGFLGANGAGKTTAIRMLCGLSHPTSGDGGAQIVTDASNPNIAQSSTVYLQAIITGNEGGAMSLPVDTRFLYNPQLRSSYNFVPGIMGMLFLLVCALMTAVAIVHEKETGTMELLLVSPTRPIQIIISKMVPFFVLSCIDLTVVMLIARYMLDVPLSGGVFPIVVVSLLYILLSLAFGLFVSTIAKSQVVAMLVCGMVMIMPV